MLTKIYEVKDYPLTNYILLTGGFTGFTLLPNSVKQLYILTSYPKMSPVLVHEVRDSCLGSWIVGGIWEELTELL